MKTIRSPLDGFRSPFGQRRDAAAFTVTLTGLSTDSIGTYGQVGNHAAIGFTIDPDNGTETVKWSASSDPGAAATFGTGASPTAFSSADGFQVYLHVTDGGETVTRSFTARKAPATGGTDLDLSFPVNQAITATNLLANWTANGNTLTFVSVSPSLPTGLSIDSAGELTGTPTVSAADNTYTLTVEDEYGREVSDTFTLQVVPATNPTLNSVTFASPGSGARQSLALSYSYPNDPAPDTLRCIIATRNGGSALTAQQLLDGTGTFLERVVINPFATSTIDLITAGLTATSEAATAVDVIVAEVNNGGVSSVVTEAVTGLDLTTEARLSIATNEAGDQVTVTWSGTLFDPAALPDLSAADFTMPGHTVSTATASGSTVVLAITPSVANGDSDTLSYSGTALVDVNGNAIETFTGAAVENNVPAPPPTLSVGQLTVTQDISGATTTRTATVDLTGYVAGDVVAIAIGNEHSVSAVTVQGNSANLEEASTFGFGQRVDALSHTLLSDGGAADEIVYTLTGSGINQVVAWGIKGGVIDEVNSVGQTGSTFPVATVGAASNANNVIVAAGIGRVNCTSFNWTNMTETSDEAVNTAGGTWIVSAARLEDAPLSSFAPTGNVVGNDRHGIAVFVISVAP